MGSFASTCTVSGLPLEAGEPVIWLLLSANPYLDNLACYADSAWIPRTLPLRAKYNDYGSIEDYDLNDLSVWATMEGFKKDLCERGWGDNMAHDVPVTKDMSFHDLLEAVWEGRVRVRNGYDEESVRLARLTAKLRKEANKAAGKPEQDFEDSLHVNYPTRKRVTKALVDAGFNMNTKGMGGDGFVVSGVGYGRVRVRWDRYDDGKERIEKLEAALPALQQRFAAMIRCGSGRCSDNAEIIVNPKPATEGHVSLTRRDRKPPMLVNQAMIHRDVWNALIKLKTESGIDYKAKVTHDMVRSDVQKIWDRMRAPKKVYERTGDSEQRIQQAIAEMEEREEFERGRMHSSANHYLTKNALGAFSVAGHFKMVAERQDLDVKQVDKMLDDVAGYVHVSNVLSTTRYWWRPSYTAGPQFGEYKMHVAVNKAFAAVADDIYRRRNRE